MSIQANMNNQIQHLINLAVEIEHYGTNECSLHINDPQLHLELCKINRELNQLVQSLSNSLTKAALRSKTINEFKPIV